MDTSLTGNIWKQIAPLARKEKRRIAAIAYVSTDDYVKFGNDDILICDASNQAIGSGETSAEVLRKFYNAGAQLYSCTNLHAKVMVFGSNALVGSANLSESSATSLREFALLSTRSSVRSQVAAFIHMTREESESINEVFLDRISKIKVVKRKGFRRRSRKNSIFLGNRTWVIRTYSLASERYKDEEKFVERAEAQVREWLSDPDSGIGWVRWAGKSTFRDIAKEGDTIIMLHSSVRRGKQITVLAPTPILKRQDRPHWTRFYYEDQDDKRKMSWTAFSRKLAKVGITSIKRNSIRELSRRDAILIDAIWEPIKG